MESETITPEGVAPLDQLLDEPERVSIQTDEALTAPADVFDEAAEIEAEDQMPELEQALEFLTGGEQFAQD